MLRLITSKSMILRLLLLLAIGWPGLSWAALAEVGSGSQRAVVQNDAGDSVALAYPGSVTSGNLLIVTGTMYNTGSGGITAGVTDTLGTSYTVKHYTYSSSTSGDQAASFIAYGVAPSSGSNTVTADQSGSPSGAAISIAIDEFSGQHASPFSVDGGGSEGSSSSPSDSITTATANELIIAVDHHSFGGGNTTCVAGGSQTLIGYGNDASGNHMSICSDFRIATTATSYAGSFTLGGSRSWEVQTASFKEATGGGGGAAARLPLLGAGP